MTTVYSNFDHEFDYEVVAELKRTPFSEAQHSGWEFCGKVYFDGKVWVEEVFRYHALVEVIKNESLEELIKEVCSKWGCE